MRVLMLRFEESGEVTWTTYEDDDVLRMSYDITASLNTVGVVKIEIYPG